MIHSVFLCYTPGKLRPNFLICNYRSTAQEKQRGGQRYQEKSQPGWLCYPEYLLKTLNRNQLCKN